MLRHCHCASYLHLQHVDLTLVEINIEQSIIVKITFFLLPLNRDVKSVVF